MLPVSKYYICSVSDALVLKNLFPISTLSKSPLTSFYEKFTLEAGFSSLYFCTSCLWNSVSK